MDILEEIRTNLNSNESLTKDFKYRIFEFVLKFNKRFPEVSLNNFKNKINTVTFEKLSSYERRGTFVYDVKKNKVLFNAKRIKEDDYDVDNLLMKSIVAIIASNDEYYGFDTEEKLYALNIAVTEMIASYIVGNEGISDYEEEIVVANLISNIIGVDLLIESYFKNDSETILRKMVEVEV